MNRNQAHAMQRCRCFAVVLALVLWASSTVLAQSPEKTESFGPYVPTPWVIVEEIMKLAAIGPGDFVVDLGSGDGRLVVTAASRYGARGGFGVDIEPTLVALANENAAKEGVADRVRFHTRDLAVTDVSPASVVTLYLLPQTIPRLERKLLAELRPGARVVSHDYPFPDWPHERFVKMDVPEKVAISGTPRTTLYLYTVPARIGGDWDLALPASLAPAPIAIAIEQRPDGASGRMTLGNRQQPLRAVMVAGETVTLTLPPLRAGASALTLRGRASGDAIEGVVDGAPWRATRRDAPR